jgi:hypothetical protein
MNVLSSAEVPQSTGMLVLNPEFTEAAGAAFRWAPVYVKNGEQAGIYVWDIVYGPGRISTCERRSSSVEALPDPPQELFRLPTRREISSLAVLTRSRRSLPARVLNRCPFGGPRGHRGVLTGDPVRARTG